MSFGLEYTLNGRRVTERQFLDGLEKQAVDQALVAVKGRIESTRCSKHGQRARATLKSRRGDRFEFNISGCCDELVRAAQRAAT
jgi:NAD-dependent SIR2 family protein deacetylase